MLADRQLLDVVPHPVYLLRDFLEVAIWEGETRLAGLEVGRGDTAHALLRLGSLTGGLVVSLAGRSVESYLPL